MKPVDGYDVSIEALKSIIRRHVDFYLAGSHRHASSLSTDNPSTETSLSTDNWRFVDG